MEEILKTSQHFLLLVFWTIVPFLNLVKIKDTGKGFLKLLLTISFVAGLIAGLFYLHPLLSIDRTPALILIAGYGFLVATYFFGDEDKDIVNHTLINCFTFLALLFYYEISNDLFAFTFWISKFVVFGVLSFAMILGHYYLVVPKLSEKPLKVAHYISWGGLLLACVYFVVSALNMNLSFSFLHLTETIFLTMRALWGIVAVFILSIFSYKLSKMRSTQSATGVLYVIVFFLIVGELMSLYFYVSKGVYL